MEGHPPPEDVQIGTAQVCRRMFSLDPLKIRDRSDLGRYHVGKSLNEAAVATHF